MTGMGKKAECNTDFPERSPHISPQIPVSRLGMWQSFQTTVFPDYRLILLSVSVREGVQNGAISCILEP